MAYKIKSKKSYTSGELFGAGVPSDIKDIFTEKKAKKIHEQRFTYDVYFGEDKSPMNFDSKESALEWIERGKKEKFYAVENSKQILIVPRKSEPYKLGEMWRDDFDYTGMIRMGSKADKSWNDKDLNKLFDSYEDVNYHTPSEPLFSAIQNRKKGKYAQAEKDLAKFREINNKLLKGWGET